MPSKFCNVGRELGWVWVGKGQVRTGFRLEQSLVEMSTGSGFWAKTIHSFESVLELMIYKFKLNLLWLQFFRYGADVLICILS